MKLDRAAAAYAGLHLIHATEAHRRLPPPPFFGNYISTLVLLW
ncbi:MAG: hypothetical protein ACREBR_00670 [bacterium]